MFTYIGITGGWPKGPAECEGACPAKQAAQEARGLHKGVINSNTNDGLLPYLNRAKDSNELTKMPTLLQGKRERSASDYVLQSKAVTPHDLVV